MRPIVKRADNRNIPIIMIFAIWGNLKLLIDKYLTIINANNQCENSANLKKATKLPKFENETIKYRITMFAVRHFFSSLILSN